MEAKELMLNDLVLYGDICKIVSINVLRDAVGLMTTSNEDNYVIHRYTKGIAPIALTPEILAKNGFDVKSMIARIWSDYLVEYEFHTHTISIKNGINTLYLKVQYVHKLQHALRECELTELADNFKVE